MSSPPLSGTHQILSPERNLSNSPEPSSLNSLSSTPVNEIALAKKIDGITNKEASLPIGIALLGIGTALGIISLILIPTPAFPVLPFVSLGVLVLGVSILAYADYQEEKTEQTLAQRHLTEKSAKSGPETQSKADNWQEKFIDFVESIGKYFFT